MVLPQLMSTNGSAAMALKPARRIADGSARRAGNHRLLLAGRLSRPRDLQDAECREGEGNKTRSNVTGGNIFLRFLSGSEDVSKCVPTTGGWSGPARSHYAEEKQVLVQLKSVETDPNALRWLNNAIHSTEKNLEAAKIEEEARGY
jgi:hypothetical protein